MLIYYNFIAKHINITAKCLKKPLLILNQIRQIKKKHTHTQMFCKSQSKTN